MWLWDWRAAYCAIEASDETESDCHKLCYFYVSACVLLTISSTKTSSSAGFEPATSGLEVRRAIHCATKTGDLKSYGSWNLALVASVGGVKVSIVAFQAIDPGSIPGRRTRFFSLRDALFSTSLVCRSNWPIRFKSNDIFHYKWWSRKAKGACLHFQVSKRLFKGPSCSGSQNLLIGHHQGMSLNSATYIYSPIWSSG